MAHLAQGVPTYGALTRAAEVPPGDIVFVSGGAGSPPYGRPRACARSTGVAALSAEIDRLTALRDRFADRNSAPAGHPEG